MCLIFYYFLWTFPRFKDSHQQLSKEKNLNSLGQRTVLVFLSFFLFENRSYQLHLCYLMLSMENCHNYLNKKPYELHFAFPFYYNFHVFLEIISLSGVKFLSYKMTILFCSIPVAKVIQIYTYLLFKRLPSFCEKKLFVSLSV